jgi:hypothetical protein
LQGAPNGERFPTVAGERLSLEVELGGVSEEDQRRLIETFVARHAEA